MKNWNDCWLRELGVSTICMKINQLMEEKNELNTQIV